MPLTPRAWRAPALVVLVALVMAACAGVEGGATGGTGGDVYVVRSGDTLYSIARRLDVDYRDLARWNNLGDGSLIYPGQRLVLAPRAGAAPAGAAADAVPSSPPPASGWRWPAGGVVVMGFGQSPRTASGILIAGRYGQPVVATAEGDVVYAGSGLAGYGQLIIIKHNDTWLSAYGYNATLIASEGDHVRSGQQIATMGEGAGHAAVLHFEIRRNGVPVDPLRYLPAR